MIVVNGPIRKQLGMNSGIAVMGPYSEANSVIGRTFTLAGKLLVDVTVPLMPPEITRVQMPAAGSAAAEAREILGEGARVAAAFHNISHVHLAREEPVPCDVLVCGVDREARDQTIKLAEAAGLTAWDAGPLENAVVAEGLTSILLGIGKRHRIQSPGIRITGEPKPKSV
jgi:hypothetical protein